MDFAQCQSLTQRIHASVAERLYGLESVMEGCLYGLFSGGHVLLMGVPGLGKTMLINALGRLLDLQFQRVQFTPDLMPGDIVGSEVLDVDPVTERKSFRFVQGPVFTNLLLADEINRTPPRTQSALLEAMQENAVTVGQQTYALPKPFTVFATMNPIEQEGTYVLPEAELDRFLLQLELEYPAWDNEKRIARDRGKDPVAGLTPVAHAQDIEDIRKLVQTVEVPDAVVEAAVRLVRATRPGAQASAEVQDNVRFGAGPRASQSLVRCASARAAMHGRPLVLLEDVETVAVSVLQHRINLTYEAIARGVRARDIVQTLARQTLRPSRG